MDNNSPTKAFTYMFKDNKFWQKYWTFFFICLLLFIPIINIFILISLCGYFLNAIKSISEQNNNIIFPFYNFKKSFKSSLLFLLAVIIFSPIIILWSLPYSLAFVAFYESDAHTLTAGPLSITVTIISLVTPFIVPAFLRYFVITHKITAFYNFVSIFESVKHDIKHYLKYALTMLICFIIFTSIPNKITLILYERLKNNLVWDDIQAIILFFILPYMVMVYAYLIAKCVREPDYIEENAQ